MYFWTFNDIQFFFSISSNALTDRAELLFSQGKTLYNVSKNKLVIENVVTGVARSEFWATSSKRSVCKGKLKKTQSESSLSLKLNIEAV